jgi:DNA topoisomerase-1
LRYRLRSIRRATSYNQPANGTVANNDRRLAQVVGHCQELPGQELLQYIDDEGQVRDIGSDDVNEYLRTITGEDFTAKDFRTWAGTVPCPGRSRRSRRFPNESEP